MKLKDLIEWTAKKTISFLSKRRYEILRELIRKNNYKSFVEIGVWNGKVSKYLLKICKLDEIICVDNYSTSNCMGSRREVTKARNKAIKLKNDNRVTFLEVTSKEAEQRVKDNSIDIIFIDAEHSYNSVRGDIELWYPKVREGGILAGHDYHINWFGVIKAVNEKFKSINIESDKVWWVKK